MTIVEFIEQRLEEREAAANEAVESEHESAIEGRGFEYRWVRLQTRDGKPTGSHAFEPGSPSPAEVLRQCAAMRVALEFYVNDDESVMAATINAIAAIWSDHSDHGKWDA